MSALDFLLPWDSQPQEVVEVNDTLKPYLTGFFHPSGRVDLATGAPVNWTGAAAAAGFGPGGAAIIGSGSNEVATTVDWGGWSGKSKWGALLRFRLRSTSQTNTYALKIGSGGEQNAILYGYASQQFEFFATGYSGTNPRTGTGISVADQNVHTLAYVNDGARTYGVLDGRVVVDVAATTTLAVSSTVASYLLSGGGGSYCQMDLYEALVWAGGGPSVGLLQDITGDPNGRLFKPRSIWVPVSAGGATGYTLTADAGAYTLSGQDATLLKTRVLTADAGSYAVGGQDASVLVGHKLTADAGAYSVAGQDATLTYVPVTPGSYTLTCDAGAYVLAGQDATLLRGRVVAADAGAYAISGADAELTFVGTPSSGVGGGDKQRKKVLKYIKRLNELILRREAPIITIQPHDETDDEEALMLLL